MILFKEKTAGIKNESILEWKVFFQCPFGITDNLDNAIKVCEENSFNPNLCIIPVAVAITQSSMEVVIK
jgi:hypothetical protein